jgi:hypothetical protein
MAQNAELEELVLTNVSLNIAMKELNIAKLGLDIFKEMWYNIMRNERETA